jgi:hypothetical protein
MKTYSIKSKDGKYMEWLIESISPSDAVAWALGHNPNDLPEPDANGVMWVAGESYTVQEKYSKDIKTNKRGE